MPKIRWSVRFASFRASGLKNKHNILKRSFKWGFVFYLDRAVRIEFHAETQETRGYVFETMPADNSVSECRKYKLNFVWFAQMAESGKNVASLVFDGN